jgi:hypothetical protein
LKLVIQCEDENLRSNHVQSFFNRELLIMMRIVDAEQDSLTYLAKTSDSERTRDADKSERLWIIGVGAMVVIQLWFGLISTSFWLDETGTWWIVKDGVAEVVQRSFSWSGQSPLFYLLAWLSSRLFGLNEIALRLPSVLAMSGAIYFLYRIAERLYDRASAAVVAFVFLCVVSFYAIDARPYALAMLCLTVSIWALLRWLETNRPLDAILYVIAGALVVYAHCIMSLGLGAGIIYGFAAARKQPRQLAWLGLLEVATALLCAPSTPQLMIFYATRSAHTIIGLPGVGGLLAGFVPCSLAGAFIIIVWICLVFRRDAGIAGKCTGLAGLLVGTWALFAPLFLFLLPVASDLRLFVDRYYSSALPGQALLVGGLLSSIQLPRVRKALILVLGAAAILTQGRFTANSHGNEDWRAAMGFIGNETVSAPVLLVSSFAEATDFRSLRDPKLHDVLFAPELLYGEPARSIQLPHSFPVNETKELERSTEQLDNQRRFYLLNNTPDLSYQLWLMGRFGSRCNAETTGQNFGNVWLVRFTCMRQQ